MSHDCLFCKIARHEIPARIVHEDDEFLAFHDINPAAPVHLLLIPKHHVASLAKIGPADGDWLARMLRLAPEIAFGNGCNPLPAGGFRLVANTGAEGGQEIDHLHFHILGGERPWSNRAAPAA
ncbi:histidine triad nucleotide-binding protein [Castellaniella ginsengisoli]|uniref:Histidine triad nucleotide-binding protein n=1 Tax=Castellaniella ginsengisoli TaxID=546114 RepID=A0ABP3W127_9BURK